MKAQEDHFFSHFIKGKVIIAFIIACTALLFAWSVSKIVFNEILKNVNNISEPVEKLRLVNNIFRDITQLDQLQRTRALQNDKQLNDAYMQKSTQLRATLDSLQNLYRDDTSQTRHIGEMKYVLKERDRLFASYLKVREGIINAKSFTRQLNSLNELIANNTIKSDTIITTEKKTSTITLLPEDSVVAPVVTKKGFLGRLFGKKKNVVAAVPVPQQKILTEEVNIQVDTIPTINTDSVKQKMNVVVQNIKTRQRERSEKFVDMETELANAGNSLTGQMLKILQQVEQEVLKQVDSSNGKTQFVVNAGADRIKAIMLVFIVITALLVYFTLADISKSVRYRRELETAKDEAEYHNKVKQRFLANMSHEIRSPLQSILGYAEQVRYQDNPDKKDIEAIYYSSEHLLQVVNQVLDYSRITSGKFTFEHIIFNIDDLMEEVVAVMQHQADKKQLTLSLINENENPQVLGDPFRLKQILYNLISNAIKFTNEGKVIFKAVSKPSNKGNLFEFSVEDTGIGISQPNLRTIFNQFEQARNIESNSNEGTGLGLGIVKELVTHQGGTIQVKSQLEKGSCFIVTLDFEKPESTIILNGNQEFLSTDFDGKIYVVDDDELILQLCSSILNKHHISNTCFNSPKDALNSSFAGVSVVLADIRMNGMNGFQLCRMLRRKVGDKIKIYALTAQALPEEREAILKYGFDGLLMKPFRETELMALLQQQEIPIYDINELSEEALDLSEIENMTLGDKDLMLKILERFVMDSENDKSELLVELEKPDNHQVPFLLHRLAGRTAQIGARELASRVREMEVSLNNELNYDLIMSDLTIAMEDINKLIGQVKKEILSRSDTSPFYSKVFSDQY